MTSPDPFEIDHREMPRAEIIESVMGQLDEPPTIDNFLGLLGVYYWWEDTWSTPSSYATEIISDLPYERRWPMIRMLHSSAPICERSKAKSMCELAAEDCFRTYCESNDITDTTVVDLADIDCWLEYLGGIDEDEDPLGDLYVRHVVDKLAVVGATDLEIGNAIEVIGIESLRRRLCADRLLQYEYAQYRIGGGSHEEFLEEILVERHKDPSRLELILEDNDDLPDDPAEMTAIEIDQVVRRNIAAHSDFFWLLEVSYQKYTHGVLPSYLHRFSD